MVGPGPIGNVEMKTKWIFLVIAALAALLWLATKRVTPTVPIAVEGPALPAPTTATAPVSPPEAKPLETESERRARLVSNTADRSDFKLSEQDVFSYLEANRSNAVSLVTAFSATGNKEFLKIAAARFPNDPLVQSKVLMHDVLPEERQKWVDAFKQSAPDNAFGNLLSAQDLMKQGNTQAALAELGTAQGKTFDDYTRETAQGLEEAYLAAGRSIAEAKVLGGSEVLLPHLAQLKGVGAQFLNAAVEREKAGDLAGQLEYLKANWEIGNHFRQSGKGVLITDLVGLVMENLTYRAWPANTPAAFVEGSLGDAVKWNTSHQAEIRGGASIFEKWFVNASEAEVISYMDRSKAFGEMDAVRWLKERHPELAN